MTPATAILVPVLARPQNVAPLVESIEAATPEPHRILFLLSDGDVDEFAAVKSRQAACDYRRGQEYAPFLDFMVCDPPGTWATKINAGYRATEEPFVFLAADDLAFTPGWLAAALRTAGPFMTGGYGVVGTNDRCNGRTYKQGIPWEQVHSTHTLVRRSYVDEAGGVWGEPGVVLHDGYDHEYADDELVDTAKARGVYAHCYEAIVRHLHPMCSGTADDDTYRLGRRHTRQNMRLFLNRRRELWDPDAPIRRRFRG